jgi:hypothetical protein
MMQPTSTRKPVAGRPTFVIFLRPESYCLDPVRALRAVLKNALRSHGMKCVGIGERSPDVLGTSSAAIAAPSSAAVARQ